MHCYEMRARGKIVFRNREEKVLTEITDAEKQKIREITEQYNRNDGQEFFFFSFLSVRCVRINAICGTELSEKQLASFADCVGIDMRDCRSFFQEISTEEMIQRGRFSRGHGLLKDNTDIFEKLDEFYDLSFYWHKERQKRKNYGHIPIH